MKTVNKEPIMRDRTYRSVEDGNYMTPEQFMRVAVPLCVTHFLLEFLYLWLGCTPMVYINIASIISYVVSILYIRNGQTMITVWIMVLEVYLHAIFACVFLGLRCGFHLWLFGTLSCVFLPYFIPDLSRRQKRQIGVFSAVIVGTFLTLSSLDRRGLLPTVYSVDETLAIVMYNVNATLAFGAIILYTAIYNIRMANKSLELQQMADHDFLTGIFNRQRLQKILDAEIRRAEKLSECHLLVAIADIDFFKEINDTYGHEIGDAALKELSDIFSEHGDKGLIYGRWGGEEFLLIAPENMSYKQFGEMLETLRREVEDNEFAHDDHTIKFTISIGAAEYERGMTAEQLVDLADDRLYSAKGNGRNKVVY